MLKYSGKFLAILTALSTMAALNACSRNDEPTQSSDVPSSMSSPPSQDQQLARESMNTDAGTGAAIGQNVDDTLITGKVKAALLAQDNLKSSDISVDTVAGKVVLSGSVPDQTQIDRAIQVARSVEGVVDVTNSLAVGG